MGLLSSSNLIGACISSIICFRYADAFGRKLEVQVAAALYITGAIVTAASPTLWGVYVGFVVYGLGIGFAMHAAPVYIAEISPAAVRGMLVSAKEAVIVLGIFAGFLAGYAFSGIEVVGWRYMVLISVAFALLMGTGIRYVPESPRFLVFYSVRNAGLVNEESLLQEARSALQFFRDAQSLEDVEEELQTMRSDIIESVGRESTKWTDAFAYPLPLLIGCGLVLLQQVTGQPSVLYYATSIFKDAGFGENAALSSTLVGLVKLLATLVTVWRVDSYGRRPLLFVGISMMAAALATIGTALLYRSCLDVDVSVQACDEARIILPQGWALATVAALMVYVSGYQVGFGPISWLIISEIFPVRVRGAALSVAAMVNFGANICVTLTFKSMQTTFTASGLFYVYLCLCLVSLMFVRSFVPETKGQTLEEIEKVMAVKQVGGASAGYGSTG